MYTFKRLLKIPPDDLERLRKTLKHGDIQSISDKTGYHRNTVMEVLRGRHENHEIIDAACQQIIDHHDKVTEQVRKIHSVIEKAKQVA